MDKYKQIALITGASGFIGSNLYDYLFKSFMYNNAPLRVIPVAYNRNISPERNFNHVKQFGSIKYIFHCGAELYDENKMLKSNIEFTGKLIKECKKQEEPPMFVYLGSSSEYGRNPRPISETTPVKPEFKYAYSKAVGSLLVKASKLQYLIARPFSVYGPGDNSNKFMQLIFNAIKREDKTFHVNEGMHDWIYIDDFIKILTHCTSLVKQGEVINIGTGIQTSNLIVAGIMKRFLCSNIELVKTGIFGKPYDTGYWICNTDKLINWARKAPRISLIRGLALLINEEKRYFKRIKK